MGDGRDFPQMWGILPYIFHQMYFAVFCSILQYFDVSEQSHVSVRIEEAFQIHVKNDRYRPQKKTKYRPGIGLAIPVSRYRSGDTRNPRVGEGGRSFSRLVVHGDVLFFFICEICVESTKSLFCINLIKHAAQSVPRRTGR